MSQSTLALSYDDIRERVGQERGYGRVKKDWTDNGDAVARIEDCMRDGTRMFYTQANHEWSFLTPLQSMTILTGTSELDLPADFGFAVDKIYFDTQPGLWCLPLVYRNEGEVLLKRQWDSAFTGRPRLAAVVADGGPTVNNGQTSKLIFWPVADLDYAIQIRYSVTPNALGPGGPYPYGGAAHSQTLLEACLAASERQDGMPGPHNAIYASALENSKAYDRRLKPRTLGNEMRLDRRYHGRDYYAPRNTTPVTFT